jgi:hypothetical protein
LPSECGQVERLANLVDFAALDKQIEVGRRRFKIWQWPEWVPRIGSGDGRASDPAALAGTGANASTDGGAWWLSLVNVSIFGGRSPEMATSVVNVSGQQQQALLQLGAAANGTSSVAWWGALGAVPGALAAVPGALSAVPGAVGGGALWVAGRLGFGGSESPKASVPYGSLIESSISSVEAAKGVSRRVNASDSAPFSWWRFGPSGARTEFSTNATQLSAIASTNSSSSSDEPTMTGAATTMDDWAAFQSFGDLDALAAGSVVQDVTPPKTALAATNNSTAVSWTLLGFRFGGKDNALETGRPAPATAPAAATATTNAAATTMTGESLIELTANSQRIATPLDGSSAATQTNGSSAVLDLLRRLNLRRPPSAPPPPPPAPPPVQPPSPLASPATALPPYARWSQPATPDPFARLWAPPPPPPPPAAVTGSAPIESIATSKKGKMAEEASAALLPSVQRWRLWRGPPELAILGSGGPPPPELAGQVVPPLKTAPVEESRDDFEEKEAAKIEAR